jgi:hypothetical protein
VKKQIRARSGSIAVTAIGITFVIILFAMFFMEINRVWNLQYSIETRAQRAVNSTVEYAMDDRYRSDGFNVMSVTTAADNLYKFLQEDLNLSSASASGGTCYYSSGEKAYTVTYSNVQYESGLNGTSSPSIHIDITVELYSNMFSYYVPGGSFKWTNSFESTNFRTDEDQYAGVW